MVVWLYIFFFFFFSPTFSDTCPWGKEKPLKMWFGNLWWLLFVSIKIIFMYKLGYHAWMISGEDEWRHQDERIGRCLSHVVFNDGRGRRTRIKFCSIRAIFRRRGHAIPSGAVTNPHSSKENNVFSRYIRRSYIHSPYWASKKKCYYMHPSFSRAIGCLSFIGVGIYIIYICAHDTSLL